LSLTDPGGGGGDSVAEEFNGMGLALAERLAATIGAVIDVPAEFDGPTTVTVTVPVNSRAV
jgi:signal transduction histidine kinase